MSSVSTEFAESYIILSNASVTFSKLLKLNHPILPWTIPFKHHIGVEALEPLEGEFDSGSSKNSQRIIFNATIIFILRDK